MRYGRWRWALLAAGCAAAMCVGCASSDEYDKVVTERNEFLKARNKYLAENDALMKRNREIEANLGDTDNQNRLLSEQVMIERDTMRALMKSGGGLITQTAEGNLALGDLGFVSGSDDLTPAAKTALKNMAEAFKAKGYDKDRALLIRGHTDDRPISKPDTKKKFQSNLHLSAMRALSTAECMVDQCGWPKDRVEIMGCGEFQPRASNKTDEGRKLNRRVEILLMAPPAALRETTHGGSARKASAPKEATAPADKAKAPAPLK